MTPIIHFIINNPMEKLITGIHHVIAIADNAQKNIYRSQLEKELTPIKINLGKFK